ncbi:cytochrome c [Pistricoccus aurantiacus]|uniref:Cytochrome c n=2 Tax=Pistricoccus aurantiacus TaxID=1883414 RepID=A0A5B8SKI1_9GAMM|nr:cytochrome c [Pistricoccus aurantiacus]
MRVLYGMLLMLLLLVVAGILFIYSGFYNVAASVPHAALTRWATHTTMHYSVEARSDAIRVPNLDDSQMIARGARTYEEMCVACHLKPGTDSTALHKGLNPPPPNLTEEDDWAPAEQFWIIDHGIKMSGMPAWGESHADKEIWEVVAFLQRLPELSEQQYIELANPEKEGGAI